MDNMYMQNYANDIENIMRGFESTVDKTFRENSRSSFVYFEGSGSIWREYFQKQI